MDILAMRGGRGIKMPKLKSSLVKTTWKNIRKDVAKINQPFAKVIDNLSPDDSYTLYRLSCPFGLTIFDKGTIYLPDKEGNSVPIDSPSIPNEIKKQLSYRAIPMGLMLNNSAEIFIEIDKRIIPLTILPQGRLFGVWETLDPPHSYFTRLAWSVVSGARSLFMLPKLSDAVGYQKLQREFSIRSPIPKKLREQWSIFREIINHHTFPITWSSEVILFGAKWHEKIRTDTAWLILKNYLYENVWQQSMFWRVEVTLNLVWQLFALGLRETNIRCGSYQLETLKHLIALGVGALPSFKPAMPADLSVPVGARYKVFLWIVMDLIIALLS